MQKTIRKLLLSLQGDRLCSFSSHGDGQWSKNIRGNSVLKVSQIIVERIDGGKRGGSSCLSSVNSGLNGFSTVSSEVDTQVITKERKTYAILKKGEIGYFPRIEEEVIKFM